MIFNINLKQDFNSRKKAMILSAIFPGWGQIYRQRYWGLVYPVIILLFFGFIFFIKRIDLLKNGLIFIGIFILYLINILDAFLGPYQRKSPCIIACPAHINIPQFIKLIADKRFEEARATVLRQMPFISVCGTICPAQCELKCVRNGYDEHVMIMKIKKSLADKNESVNPINYPVVNKRIGIIGGGVAGLSLAYFLSQKNVKSIIYEKMDEVGGLLRYAIPRFRIDLLDILKDIQPIIENDNIDIKYNMEIGKDISLNDIKKENNFTVIATGNNEYVCPDKDIVPDNHVYHGLDILKSIAKGENVELGKDIAIIGGGNTAIDVARTMLRLGANVHIYYRKSFENMKANKQEIEDAVLEGIEILTNIQIKNIIENNNTLIIDFIDNNENIVQKTYTSLIYATGQRFSFDMDPIVYSGRGYKTSDKHVFILRDMGTIVETVVSAHKLSNMIYRRIFPFRSVLYLMYDNIQYVPIIRDVPDAAWNYSKPTKIQTINTMQLENRNRIQSFFKVDRDLSDAESIAQAKRCLDCPRKHSLPFSR